MSDAPKPTDWHKKPRGYSRKACPICGYPANQCGQHRAVTDQERASGKRTFKGRWVRQRWTARGHEAFAVGVPTKREHSRASATTQRSRAYRRAQQAATLMATGLTQTAAAQRLGLHGTTVCNYRQRFPELWQEADALVEADMRRMVDQVRAEAGTDAVMEDPDAFCERAEFVEKWAARKGEVLFPSNGEPTLCSFYRDYYLPVAMSPDASDGYRQQFDIALRRWRLLTGDPPLKDITPEVLAKFRNTLAKMRGIKRHQRMMPRTIVRFLKYVQCLLDKAGPPGPRNRDAAGILDRAPWIRPPRVPVTMPEAAPVEHVEAAYLAAPCMVFPIILGFKPAAWWRALLVLTYCTGLRTKTLFALRMEWIDWQGRRIVVPPQSMKARRAHVAYLNPTAVDHLRAIRTDRELVFPWPHGRRQFHRWLHKLQQFAAIPRDQHFTLKRLRKTHITSMWRESPEAARLSAGHAGIDVTISHYVEAESIVSAAVDRLPIPGAFNNGRG